MNWFSACVRYPRGRSVVPAAVLLGLAPFAAGGFVPSGAPDFRQLQISAAAWDGIDTKSSDHFTLDALMFQPFAVAESVAAAESPVSSNLSGTHSSVISPNLITFTGQVVGDFSPAIGFGYTICVGASTSLCFFNVEPPGMNVAASMELLLDTTNVPIGQSLIRLQRWDGPFPHQVIFDFTLGSPGFDTHSQVFNGFLAPGLYIINTYAHLDKNQSHKSDVSGSGTASYELIVVGNACGDTEIRTFNLPPEGAPFDFSMQVGATTITVPAHLVGSAVAELLLDCDQQIVGVSILSIDLDVLEPSLVFDLGDGTFGTVSNLHYGVDSMVGMLGPPAAVSGGCCGTILGCLPHLTGDAVITTPDLTLPLTFDVPLDDLYSGIDFDLAPVAIAGGAGGGDFELTVFLDHAVPTDLGLGKLNPTLIFKGAITGTTVAPCAAADLDCNGVVNTFDLGTLLASWTIPPQTSACGGALPCVADINHDGAVNTLDLGILLASWTL